MQHCASQDYLEEPLVWYPSLAGFYAIVKRSVRVWDRLQFGEAFLNNNSTQQDDCNMVVADPLVPYKQSLGPFKMSEMKTASVCVPEAFMVEYKINSKGSQK
eukprot:6324381-Amphidinium_carterae.1